MKWALKIGAGAILSLAVAAPHSADACSRAVYFGLEGQTITGRTMDWVVPDIDTNLWLYPRGLERSSNTANPLVWKAKHGTVVAAIYEGAAADGMNEQGLVANLLYLVGAEYEPETEGDTRPTLPVSAWVQYMLDNYATVAEAVEGMRKGEFRVVTVVAPSGQKGLVHLSVSDASGDSAIFEFIGGKLVIHHSRDYQIMTNEPTYDQQLGLANYWKEIGGSVMLPGTNRAADRFARLSYYINATTQTADPRAATATVFSIMRNVSVPKGITTPGRPNIADTLWLAVADQKNKVYFFQDTNSASAVWVNLNKLDFGEGSGPRKLQLDGNPDLAGDQTANFQPADLFKFITEH
jgi:penicillin V acylase-like amidase (Ntn superfamily)